jgi:hypothetical protein
MRNVCEDREQSQNATGGKGFAVDKLRVNATAPRELGLAALL